MINGQHSQRAASIVEYAVLFVMFLTAIMLMQKQIARAIFGRWKDLGDSFGYGQQYDPKKTIECASYTGYTTTGGWGSEVWYLVPCYESCYKNIGGGACPGAPSIAKRQCCANNCKSTSCDP